VSKSNVTKTFQTSHLTELHRYLIIAKRNNPCQLLNIIQFHGHFSSAFSAPCGDTPAPALPFLLAWRTPFFSVVVSDEG